MILQTGLLSDLIRQEHMITLPIRRKRPIFLKQKTVFFNIDLTFLILTAQNLLIISEDSILGNNCQRRGAHHEIIIS